MDAGATSSAADDRRKSAGGGFVSVGKGGGCDISSDETDPSRVPAIESRVVYVDGGSIHDPREAASSPPRSPNSMLKRAAAPENGGFQPVAANPRRRASATTESAESKSRAEKKILNREDSKRSASLPQGSVSVAPVGESDFAARLRCKMKMGMAFAKDANFSARQGDGKPSEMDVHEMLSDESGTSLSTVIRQNLSGEDDSKRVGAIMAGQQQRQQPRQQHEHTSQQQQLQHRQQRLEEVEKEGAQQQHHQQRQNRGALKNGYDDNVFIDLQGFKEENGDILIPASHPIVSHLTRILSSHEVKISGQNGMKPHHGSAQWRDEESPAAQPDTNISSRETAGEAMAGLHNGTAAPQRDEMTELQSCLAIPPPSLPRPGVGTHRIEPQDARADAEHCADRETMGDKIRKLQSSIVVPEPPLPAEMMVLRECGDDDAATKSSSDAEQTRRQWRGSIRRSTMSSKGGTSAYKENPNSIACDGETDVIGSQKNSSSTSVINAVVQYSLEETELVTSALRSSSTSDTFGSMTNMWRPPSPDDPGVRRVGFQVPSRNESRTRPLRRSTGSIPTGLAISEEDQGQAQGERTGLGFQVPGRNESRTRPLWNRRSTGSILVGLEVESQEDQGQAQSDRTGQDTPRGRRFSLLMPFGHAHHPARQRATHFLPTMPRFLISATLVEEPEEQEVFMAEPVGFMDRNWKRLASIMCILLCLMAVVLTVTITLATTRVSGTPTFDSRPTLGIIQSRGLVRCGLKSVAIESQQGPFVDLCRSIAATVVGNPDSFKEVPVTSANRWQYLHENKVDVLLSGDTYTIEREVRESSTGYGFTFSSIYNYDGLVYFGNETFVKCAEEQMRHNQCVSLRICVEWGSTHYDFLKRSLPSDFLKIGQTFEETTEMLFNGTCNVAANDKSVILNTGLSHELGKRNFVLGEKMMTNEPLAIVTRNTDREFSDTINWVLQALFRGEEQGLTKDSSKCRKYPQLPSRAWDLDFMSAVHCVGHYGDILGGSPQSRDMNQINNGTGMLYAIPYGNLEKDFLVDPSQDSMLAKIGNGGSLNCGLVVPEGFEGSVTESNKIIGMGADYCRTLSSALLMGDSEGVNILTFSDNDDDSFESLANGTIDLLVGATIQRKYDFQQSSSSREGFYFSTPYYYGNEDAVASVSFKSIATREDDVLFSSFVNSIVLATIYAEENGITRESSNEMPLVSVFGSGFSWALIDAIAYSGNYEEIYSKNFDGNVVFYVFPASGQLSGQQLKLGSNISQKDRGRNSLNEGGPMVLSFPQLP